ncbi:hypothetical protein SH661x_002713 [Planctomicrobium sp. SH661]|uniref:hypothetical protein n=1 Tax=Planctomicrobium sp. SH661 TaxID=3448124 RepID=UPI003F5BE330
MTCLRTIWIVLTLAGWGMSYGSLVADDEPAFKLRFPSSQAAVFGDVGQAWTISLDGTLPDDALLSWEYSANDRILSRGEVPIEMTDAGSRARISLHTPPVKDGVTFQSMLTVTLSQQGKLLAQDRMPVWIFANDPFFQRHEWLKELDLRVLDPGQSTRETLERAHVPYDSIKSTDLVKSEPLRIVIADGILLDKNRTQGERLLRAAASGTQVLLISPRRGSIPIPGAMVGQMEELESLTFCKEEVITRFDKRLDARTWTSADSELHQVHISISNGLPALFVSQEKSGWEWVEARFHNGGRFILCSYPLFSTWDDGPTSRYLFARILESLEHDRPVD